MRDCHLVIVDLTFQGYIRHLTFRLSKVSNALQWLYNIFVRF
jgi:hypothetical protein